MFVWGDMVYPFVVLIYLFVVSTFARVFEGFNHFEYIGPMPPVDIADFDRFGQPAPGDIVVHRARGHAQAIGHGVEVNEIRCIGARFISFFHSTGSTCLGV